MNRKRIYRIGIIVIILLVLQNPITLLIFGKVSKGKVVEKVYESAYLSIVAGASFYPRVDFSYNYTHYSILGSENQNYQIGDSVKVIFYKKHPEKAQILSFVGLFIKPVIELPLGLLIWWALFKSYPTLFDPTISKKQYVNYLLRGKLKKKVYRRFQPPLYLKGVIVFVMLILTGVLLFMVWKIIGQMLGGNISYQLGIGLAIVLLIFNISLIHKVFKELFG